MSNTEDLTISIRTQLNTKFIGHNLYYYPKLTSTMDIAKRKAQEGADEGTVVIADEQTSGRGQLSRTWLSPRGNLALSLILKPSLDKVHQLIMITSLAVVRTIKKVADIEADIKWPNDVLIGGKKVCGILIENEVQHDKIRFAIIGIGINIDLDPLATPEISSIATSLSSESGKEITKDKAVIALLSEIEQLYLESQAGAPIHQEWKRHMGTLGKHIRVKAGESIEQGKAETVTEGGNLILRRADGSTAEIVVGDVTLMRD
jgi:BirA family biotin operon repressor/biotin-[acetyl-CoA-carboxylase] ligase